MNRAERLRQLIHERFGGNQAEFATAIKRSPSVVWQYLSGHRSMGEKFARYVEQRLRLEHGWLDRVDDAPSEQVLSAPHVTLIPDGARVIAWDTLEDLDPDVYETIPHYDVHLSAGDGATAEWVRHEDNDPLAFRRRWFIARRLRPKDLRALHVRGSSMEPTLEDRDTVVIDTTRTQIVDDEIFAVIYHGDLFIKRLFRLPGGGVELRSDNTRHRTWEVAGEDLQHLLILGMKVWRGG